MSVGFLSPLFSLHGPAAHAPAAISPPSQLEHEVDSTLRERVNVWYEVRDYIAWLAEAGSDASSDESSDEDSEDENAAASDEASTNGNGVTANGHGNGNGRDSRSTASSAEANSRINKVSHICLNEKQRSGGKFSQQIFLCNLMLFTRAFFSLFLRYPIGLEVAFGHIFWCGGRGSA
jgi:hypothetical protein